MIWPFSTISTLRSRELDYNRQIATLTARLDMLSQENSRLHAQLSTERSQYIDDLRLLANLKERLDSPPSPSDDPIGAPLLRSKVQEAIDEFRTKPLDMLGSNGAWYERARELNNSPADSQEAS